MPMPAILAGLGKAVVDGVSGFVKRRQENTRIKQEGKQRIAEAKVEYQVAKYQARAARILAKENNDASYDMQVLRNREHSIADEILIFTTMAIWLMHYVPLTQPYMAGGWAAMGYEGVPWWFEFVILGIFISTLGLMRLFRLFFNRKFGISVEDDPDRRQENARTSPPTT